jgi:maltose alpha-D-glucosyltransferase/alpha-amylase
LLSATKRLISVRKSTLAFGRGSMTFIRPVNRAVLAYVRQLGDEVILCVANLSRSAQATELDLSAFKDRVPLEMLGRTHFPAIGERPYMITLAPYGFYWFQLQEHANSEFVTRSVVPEFETLVVPVGATWVSLARTRGVFERDVMPGHLARSRWYPEHDPSQIRPTLTSAIPFCDIGDNRPWLTFFEPKQNEGSVRYTMPLQIEWVRFDRERFNPHALAAVRQGAREGTLLDVAFDPIFHGLLLRNLRQSLTIEENGMGLEFRPTSRFSPRPIKQPERVTVVDVGPLSSMALLDDNYCVKLYRKLEPGINPEMEIGRFLTEVVGFANTPAMLGGVELADGETRSAVAIVHAFVGNQGDAWTVAAAHLDRFVEEQRLLTTRGIPGESDERLPLLRHMSQIGRRTAEMHLAFATASGLTDFVPEPIRPSEVKRWTDKIAMRAERVFENLRQRRDSFSEADRPLVDRMLTQQAVLCERLEALLPQHPDSLNIRHHGDFNLARSLIVKDDIFITGFKGDLRLGIEERRRKAPAARDVASLIRSIEHSANAALERALNFAPDEHGRLAAALAEWVNRASEAFLATYREFMTNSSLWPEDHAAAARMLDFFLLEKIFDELESDLAQRPERVRTSLAGALRILSSRIYEAT